MPFISLVRAWHPVNANEEVTQSSSKLHTCPLSPGAEEEILKGRQAPREEGGEEDVCMKNEILDGWNSGHVLISTSYAYADQLHTPLSYIRRWDL